MMYHPRSRIAKENADELFDLKVIQGCLAASKDGDFDLDELVRSIGRTGSQRDFEFVLHLRAVMEGNLDVDSWLAGGTVNGRERIKLNIESRLVAPFFRRLHRLCNIVQLISTYKNAPLYTSRITTKAHAIFKTCSTFFSNSW